MAIVIRPAVATDHGVIVEYNRRMASETEHLELDVETLSRGVAAALNDSNRALYLVAEIDGNVVGQLMITTEWSDWRNGWIWWLQSVYVDVAHRRKGVFRALYTAMLERAKSRGDVVGIRLYVDRTNERAQSTYQSLGMGEANYLLYERLPL